MSIQAKNIEDKIDVVDGYHDVPTADAVTNTQVRDVVGNKTDAAVVAAGTTKTLMAYLKGLVSRTFNTGVTIVQDSAFGTGTANTVATTSSATINTFGSWAQLDASTAADYHVAAIGIFCSSQAIGQVSYTAEIGIGGAGAESPIMRFSGYLVKATDTDAWYTTQDRIVLPFPIKIASGTRIAARVADGVASAVIYYLSISNYAGM